MAALLRLASHGVETTLNAWVEAPGAFSDRHHDLPDTCALERGD